MAANVQPSEKSLKEMEVWAAKTGRPIDDFVKMYVDAYVVLTKDHQTPQLRDEIAYSKVRTAMRSELASPAPTWNGVVLGFGDAVDTNVRLWADAKAQFIGAEKQQWVEKGFITTDGKPIDRRPTYSTGRVNPNFGKPYPENNWMRNAIGVFANGESTPMATVVTLSGEIAKIAPPVQTPVTVRLMNRTPEAVKDQLMLGNSSVTEWRVINDPNIPDPEVVVETYMAKYFTTLANLPSHHAKFVKGYEGAFPNKREKLDPTRLTLLDVNLMVIDREANKTGSFRIVVEDDSLGVEGEEVHRGTAIFVPPMWFHYVNSRGESLAKADEGTRVFALVQTAQPQKSRNFQTQMDEDVPADINGNLLGIIFKKDWYFEKVVAPADDVV